jgi:hypothetical protein
MGALSPTTEGFGRPIGASPLWERMNRRNYMWWMERVRFSRLFLKKISSPFLSDGVFDHLDDLGFFERFENVIFAPSLRQSLTDFLVDRQLTMTMRTWGSKVWNLNQPEGHLSGANPQ